MSLDKKSNNNNNDEEKSTHDENTTKTFHLDRIHKDMARSQTRRNSDTAVWVKLSNREHIRRAGTLEGGIPPGRKNVRRASSADTLPCNTKKRNSRRNSESSVGSVLPKSRRRKDLCVTFAQERLCQYIEDDFVIRELALYTTTKKMEKEEKEQRKMEKQEKEQGKIEKQETEQRKMEKEEKPHAELVFVEDMNHTNTINNTMGEPEGVIERDEEPTVSPGKVVMKGLPSKCYTVIGTIKERCLKVFTRVG